MSINTSNDYVTSVGNAWIICKSKSYAGRIYYFNTSTGQAVWNLSEPEIEKAKSATRILEKQQGITLNCPEPSESPKDFLNPKDSNYPNFKHPLPCLNFQNIIKKKPTDPVSESQTIHFNSINPLQLNIPLASVYNQPQILNTQRQVLVAPVKEIIPQSQSEDYSFIPISSTPIPLSHRFTSNQNIQTFSSQVIKNPFHHQKQFLDDDDDVDLRVKLSARKREKLKEQNYSPKFMNKRVRFQDVNNAYTETNDENKHNICDEVLNHNYNEEDKQIEVNSEAINISALKKLFDSEENIKQWFVVTDTGILFHDIDFLNNLLSADKQLHLVVPQVVMDEIQAATNSDLRTLAHRAAYFISQQVDWGLADIDQERSGPFNKYDIMNCCKRLFERGDHVMLLTNDMKLLDLQRSVNFPILSVNKIQKLCTSPLPEKIERNPNDNLNFAKDYTSRIKIIIPNNSNVSTHINNVDLAIEQNIEQNKLSEAVEVQAIVNSSNGENTINDSCDVRNIKNQLGRETVLPNDSGSAMSKPKIRLYRRSFSSSSTTINSLTSERKNYKWNRKRTHSSTNFDSNVPNGDTILDIGRPSNTSLSKFKRIPNPTDLEENLPNGDNNSYIDFSSDACVYKNINFDENIHKDVKNGDSGHSTNSLSFKTIKIVTNLNESRPVDNTNSDNSSNSLFLEHSKRTQNSANLNDKALNDNTNLETGNFMTTSLSENISGQKIENSANLNENISSITSGISHSESEKTQSSTRVKDNIPNNESECYSSERSFNKRSYSKNNVVTSKDMDKEEKNVMFEVTDKDMEDYLRTRCDEWVSRFTQIMEEALTQVLQQDPPFIFDAMPPPWTLYESAECIKMKFSNDSDITDAANKLSQILLEMGGLRGKIKVNVTPQRYMKMYSYGVYLIDSLQGLLSSSEDLQTASESLSKLLRDIQQIDLDQSIQDKSFGDVSTQEMNNTTNENMGISHEEQNDASDSHVENVQTTLGPIEESAVQEDIENTVDESSSQLTSPRTYNLRSLRRFKVTKEVDATPDLESTFFSSLNLQKNLNGDDTEIPNETASNNEVNESNENDTGKCVADKSNESSQQNNEMLDQECTEPKIIRNFTMCFDMEQKIQNRYSNYDQFYETLDYEDDSHENRYDQEYYDENNDEENYYENGAYEDDEYICKSVLTDRVIAEAKKCFASVNTFCDNSLKKISSSDKEDLRLQDTEKILSYIGKICCSLESLLKREENNTDYFFTTDPSLGSDYTYQDEINEYRSIIEKCLEQGKLLEKIVQTIITAIHLIEKS